MYKPLASNLSLALTFSFCDGLGLSSASVCTQPNIVCDWIENHLVKKWIVCLKNQVQVFTHNVFRWRNDVCSSTRAKD